MSASSSRSFAASLTILVALVPGACSVLNDYEPVVASGGGGSDGGATSTGGSGGTGGATGAGGELPTCNDAACQAGSTECTTCACLQGLVCDCDPLTMGTACALGVCDGAGTCVDCLDTADCPDNFVCDGTTCVDGGCTDMEMNNQETDVDCGGVNCAPCPDGKTCLVGEDCVSVFCDDNGLCDACTQQQDCGTSLYCNLSVGNCDPLKGVGDSCVEGYECLSGTCTQFAGLGYYCTS